MRHHPCMVKTGHERGTGTYWPALDGVRALLILLVFLTHLPLRHWRGGFVGVDVFFCLSGFLISTLLFVDTDRHGRVRLGPFYARRLARLYPALLVGILVAGVVVLMSTTYHLRSFLLDAGAAATYTTNFRTIVAHPVTPIGQYWSLAVEEQFYLLWAPVVLLVHRRYGLTKRTLQVAAATFVVIVAVKAAVLWSLAPKASNYAYYLLPGHADELLLGGLLALACRVYGLRMRTPWPALVACIALVVMAYGVDDKPDQLTATVQWLGAAVLGAVIVLHVVTGDSFVTRVFAFAPVRWLGARSYAFYVYHVAVLRGLLEVFGRRPGITGPLGFVGTAALAGLSWRYVEEPVLRWRDRHRETSVGAAGPPEQTAAQPSEGAEPSDQVVSARENLR
jgi:peptidoglycan/LPS O-acetylase OafA/YrhL